MLPNKSWLTLLTVARFLTTSSSNMTSFQTNLFFRVISHNKESYFLKAVTMAVTFACCIVVILFCLHEFGYDKFHKDSDSVFRILQKNNNEVMSGNRFSNRIPIEIFQMMKSFANDSIVVSRVKPLEELVVLTESQVFSDERAFFTDLEIASIFSFEIIDGSLDQFNLKNSVMLSSSKARRYFGSVSAVGKKLRLFTLGDTITLAITAVYADFPSNSHQDFSFIARFDSTAINSLWFDPGDVAVYSKIIQGGIENYESKLNQVTMAGESTYSFQPISEIHFGPRVNGENVSHGDYYSILILIAITSLIFFLALTSIICLTTLTLPQRSKELAIKKLTGTSHLNLSLGFLKESFVLVSISFLISIALLFAISDWIDSILAINLASLVVSDNVSLITSVILVFLIFSLATPLLASKFTRATPIRLLSTDVISFPRLKRIITFLQLGVSLFLIVASIVINRQIKYSLVKEPGRNHDQVVYVNYPKELSTEGLERLSSGWKKNNPNIIDVMATSQLPDQISSKEVNSAFYKISVNRSFNEFFDLRIVEGSWFKANDGDSIFMLNERGRELEVELSNVRGTFKDFSAQFHQPEKPLKISISSYSNYNFLCIRVLEVDIRQTIGYLSRYFGNNGKSASIRFMDKHFEEWLNYQDRLNTLSEILAIISLVLSCCAIYALSISLVRDKIKQLAIHKLLGANTLNIIFILAGEFARLLLIAILFFAPLTYIAINEALRNFVYATHLTWMDSIFPLVFCGAATVIVCTMQTLSLSREDLSKALKG